MSAFLREWAAIIQRRGITCDTLGDVLGHPVRMGHRPSSLTDAPRVMITAGFHGEEPAGPWGLLAMLEGVSDALLDQVHLSLLPLVNSTGFAAGRRRNLHGEKPNRGFGVHCGGNALSVKGRLLVQHASRLLPRMWFRTRKVSLASLDHLFSKLSVTQTSGRVTTEFHASHGRESANDPSVRLTPGLAGAASAEAVAQALCTARDHRAGRFTPGVVREAPGVSWRPAAGWLIWASLLFLLAAGPVYLPFPG